MAGLTLVKAPTGGDIGPLTEGETIDLHVTGSALNVRADPGANVGSVTFILDGQLVKIETAAPLALAGDDANGYIPWTPALGAHTLTVTAFSGAGGTGTAGPGDHRPLQRGRYHADTHSDADPDPDAYTYSDPDSHPGDGDAVGCGGRARARRQFARR